MKHAAIFVEGYQDRAFLSEWFQLAGIERGPRDAKRGIYVKRARSGSELWIVPTAGTSGLTTAFGDFVAARGGDFDEYLVLQDSDQLTVHEAERRLLQSLGTPPADASLNVACWAPRLEGVIEAALRTVYPSRMPALDRFLSDRVDPPAPTGKELAFAFCAGWRPDSFGDDFFADVLRKPELKVAIEARMANVVTHLKRLADR
jgi:hypothetical protein